jgi:hypothetical protein
MAVAPPPQPSRHNTVTLGRATPQEPPGAPPPQRAKELRDSEEDGLVAVARADARLALRVFDVEEIE